MKKAIILWVVVLFGVFKCSPPQTVNDILAVYFNPLIIYNASNLTQVVKAYKYSQPYQGVWDEGFVKECAITKGYIERYGILSNTNYVGLFISNKIYLLMGTSSNYLTNTAVTLHYPVYFGVANEKYYTVLQGNSETPKITVYDMSNNIVTNIEVTNREWYGYTVQYAYVKTNGNEILGNDLVVALGRGESDLIAYCADWYSESTVMKMGRLYLLNLSNGQEQLISSNVIDVVGFSPKNRYLFYTMHGKKLIEDTGRHVGQPVIYDTVTKTNYTFADYSVLGQYDYTASLGDGVYAFSSDLKSIYLWIGMTSGLPYEQDLIGGDTVSNVVGLWKLDISSLGLSE